VEFVYRVLATAVGVWVATAIPGIDVLTDSTPARIGTVIGVAVVFGLVNTVIKPVAKLVGCVFYLLTLGLIGLVVNALLFLLTGWLADKIGLPFTVTGFWPGFWGAIVVSLISFLLTLPLHFRKSTHGRGRPHSGYHQNYPDYR
jgi:putative membrane protein